MGKTLDGLQAEARRGPGHKSIRHRPTVLAAPATADRYSAVCVERDASVLIFLDTGAENGRAWVIVDDSTVDAARRVTEIVDEIVARSGEAGVDAE